MANEKVMDQVILGLLQHESLTGYEIKKRIDTVLRFFWNASFGSIYPTLNQLETAGCVTKEQIAGSGRNKILYTITDAGRIRLEEWLRQPVQKDELRYETLLKLFFGAGTEKNVAIEHIDRFEAKVKASLPFLEGSVQELRGILDASEDHTYYLLTALFGVNLYNASLDWCAQARKILEAAQTSKDSQ